MKKSLIAITGVALLGFGQMAIADDYAVKYSTQELTNGAGVASVHERIVKAAKDYCPTYSKIRNNKEVKACVDGVVEDLVSKVNHPRLTSYHAGDDGQRIASS